MNYLPAFVRENRHRGNLINLFRENTTAFGVYFMIIELQKGLPPESDYKLDIEQLNHFFLEYFRVNMGSLNDVMKAGVLERDGHKVYCPVTRMEMLKKQHQRLFASKAGKASVKARREKRKSIA